jgi:hypothetical protein
MSDKSVVKYQRMVCIYVLATTVLVFLMVGSLRADDTYWGLIVHGGGTTHALYNNGVLRVEFRHSRHPAGDSLHYENQVPSGQAKLGEPNR